MLAEIRDRPGDHLSGGQQQMLAIARALVGEPELLLLDEPNEGLAPVIVQQIGTLIEELSKVTTILLTVKPSWAGKARPAAATSSRRASSATTPPPKSTAPTRRSSRST